MKKKLSQRYFIPSDGIQRDPRDRCAEGLYFFSLMMYSKPESKACTGLRGQQVPKICKKDALILEIKASKYKMCILKFVECGALAVEQTENSRVAS